jgi:citryl-CoA lyase
MKRNEWASPVSTVQDGEILVRGYPIRELIEQLSFSDAVYLVLRGELPSPVESAVMRACLLAILDYAVGPAPIAARVVASANPQLGPAMAAGILAQGAYAVSPQDTGEFIRGARRRLEDFAGDVDRAAVAIVEETRAAGRRIPGLGHPSNLGEDERAAALERVLRTSGLWGTSARLYAAVHATFVRATGKPLVINVDGMLGVALTELGFDPVEMGGIAALSMLPGIIANVVHELKAGVRIRTVEDMVYTGPRKRHLAGETARHG